MQQTLLHAAQTYFGLASCLVFAALRSSSSPLWSGGPAWFLAKKKGHQIKCGYGKSIYNVYLVDNNEGIDTHLQGALSETKLIIQGQCG